MRENAEQNLEKLENSENSKNELWTNLGRTKNARNS